MRRRSTARHRRPEVAHLPGPVECYADPATQAFAELAPIGHRRPHQRPHPRRPGHPRAGALRRPRRRRSERPSTATRNHLYESDPAIELASTYEAAAACGYLLNLGRSSSKVIARAPSGSIGPAHPARTHHPPGGTVSEYASHTEGVLEEDARRRAQEIAVVSRLSRRSNHRRLPAPGR
jgi:hypothetical protein